MTLHDEVNSSTHPVVLADRIVNKAAYIMNPASIRQCHEDGTAVYVTTDRCMPAWTTIILRIQSVSNGGDRMNRQIHKHPIGWVLIVLSVVLVFGTLRGRYGGAPILQQMVPYVGVPFVVTFLAAQLGICY